jgi:hypothetical protein
MPTVVANGFYEAGRIVAEFLHVKNRTFLLHTWQDLVNTTPVKTGKARASWFVSPGFPITKELPDGIYAKPTAPDLGQYNPRHTRWLISNTAPYIEKLNRGSSKQAPAGFIQSAIYRNLIKYG